MVHPSAMASMIGEMNSELRNVAQGSFSLAPNRGIMICGPMVQVWNSVSGIHMFLCVLLVKNSLEEFQGNRLFMSDHSQLNCPLSETS